MADAGSDVLHAELANRDPVMAERLFPGDSQRIARALEVITATGKSLAEWQRQAPPVAPYRPVVMTVLPPREDLYSGIDKRFEPMVAQGALAAVKHTDVARSATVRSGHESPGCAGTGRISARRDNNGGGHFPGDNEKPAICKTPDDLVSKTDY